MPAIPSLASFVAVAAGGALGAVLRFGVSVLFPVTIATQIPWATLGINVVGSLALGALVGLASAGGEAGSPARLFLTVGLLGGFTTFSTFAVETVGLAQSGQLARASLYVALSLAGALLAATLGFAMTRG